MSATLTRIDERVVGAHMNRSSPLPTDSIVKALCLNRFGG